MMTKMKTVGIALLSVMTITAKTQTTSIKERELLYRIINNQKRSEPPIEAQLREMRVELQSEIDDLKTSLAAKDVQIAALQAKMQTAQEGAGTTAVQVQLDRQQCSGECGCSHNAPSGTLSVHNAESSLDSGLGNRSNTQGRG